MRLEKFFWKNAEKMGEDFCVWGYRTGVQYGPAGIPVLIQNPVPLKNSAGYGITLAKIWKVWYKICTVKTEFQERSVMQYA